MSRNLLNISNEVYNPTISGIYTATTSNVASVATVNNNNVSITGGRISNVFMDKIKTFNLTDSKSIPIGVEIKNNYGSNLWGIKTLNNQLYFRNEDYLNNKEIMTLDISRKVGIGTTNPKNSLDVNSNMAIGSLYAGIKIAPFDGLIVQGSVGIGTSAPINTLDIGGSVVIGSTYAGNKKTPKDGLLVQGNTELSGILQVGGIISSGDDFSVGPAKSSTFYVKALSGDTFVAGTFNVGKTINSKGDLSVGNIDASVFYVDALTGDTEIHGTLQSYRNFYVGLPNLIKFTVNYDTGNTYINGTLNVINDFTIGKVGLSTFEVSALTGDTIIHGNLTVLNKILIDNSGNTVMNGNLTVYDSITSSQPVLNITSDTINIGTATGTVNILGGLNYIESTNLIVSDSIFVINKNGLANSAVGSGFLIEEGGVYTGYIKTSNDRNNFLVKAPANVERYMVTQDFNYDFSANIITSNEIICNKLNIINQSTITGIVNMENDLIINIDKFIVIASTGDTTINGILKLNNNFNINDNYTVDTSGNTNIYGYININDNYIIDVSGNTIINGYVNLNNSININDNFFVDTSGNTIIYGDLNIGLNTIMEGTLDVVGITTLTRDTIIGGNLSINQNTIIGGNIDIGGQINGSSMILSGNSVLDGNLNVSGNTNIIGSIEVSGLSRFDDSIILTGDMSITGNTTMTGDLSFYNINNTIKCNNINTINNTDTLNIIGGTINIGNISSVINIMNDVKLNQLKVKSPLITLNNTGLINSSFGGGIQFEENNNIVSYIKISNDGTNFVVKPPNGNVSTIVTKNSSGDFNGATITCSTLVTNNLTISNISNISRSYLLNYNPLTGIVSYQPTSSTSDRRLKKNIQDCNTKKTLELVNKIRFRNFSYIDEKNKWNIGAIANEIEEIDEFKNNGLVNEYDGYIPSIYKNCNVKYDNMITIFIDDIYDLHVNDKIMYTINDINYETNILEIQSNNIKIKNKNLHNNDSIFLYGKYINNIKHIKNDNLIWVALPAIQELSKENTMLKNKINKIENDYKNLFDLLKIKNII